MRILYIFLISLIGIVFCSSDMAFAKSKSKSKQKTKRISRAHVAVPAIYGVAQLSNELNNIINSGISKADITVYVKSMKNSDSLYARNIYEFFTPASTLKILTAEAALLYLGPDYRFSTRVLTDAKTVKNGILEGNLYIVLSGDPTLTYYDLVDLMLTLKSQQIQAIAGNVYIDNTAYDESFYGPGWVWEDKNYCYAAPISASIINHNCISFKVAPSKVTGRLAQVVTSPKYFYPPIKNSVVTRANPSRSCSVRLSKDPGSMISIDGCMPKGRYAWGVSYVVTDIPEYNRALFKNLLSRQGINVFGSVTFGSTPQNLSLVGAHASKPLRLLINDMLKKSDNIIAGALFKKLGQLYTRQPGSWENGSFAVSQILSKRAGVNIAGLRVLDGSGLSPDNLTSASQMMQVLDFAFHHYPTSYEFVSALPIAGVDGTLKHRMGNIARKVRAKTGTISGVVSLAGYAVSGDKEPLAFVIMINGSKGLGWRYKAIEDKIVTALTRYKRLG
ncbi:D-alanyl-D-alanine carboxypeptidase/D-alanyl-D-alanine endopeptidase [Aquicella lusitana]|uniref:D-alanyl-D-alanine carboxypeptidase/D-alanyl-D-alanine-endopeptidase (Penicillin-binding protein 4) n=1 Tax=Aquicella lusitana TaxID=254246 RepID=A0A370GS40_9COXI|nr:D-alanyl-D-alanine carboxypeptidase/D-alanyl-D-alanine-endopeptidase [Aquicella lusitana]RDI46518.1 D-alanyl-D-alanine carboxypeptidase/D-alanyl-D-alanine-endopeptidase (penicillin-binding protein 4) [Aquicella lusitana]VVC74182.1 D-alanyl-D-alanine carboxypeptidase DacB [Aquicella lusitana]